MSKTIKKDFFAPLFKGLGATRRAAMLQLVMMLTMTAQTAWAQDAIDGLTYNSAGGYYEINDAQDLVDLATYVNSGNNASGKTFKQTQDINMSSIGNLEPIGSQPESINPTPFNGTYDGQGNAIIGLTVNTSSPYAGLFGKLQNGSVRNVTMVNPHITSNDNSVGMKYAGGIVGIIKPGTIENCNVINQNSNVMDPMLNTHSRNGLDCQGAICGGITKATGSAITNCYYYTATEYVAVEDNRVGVSVTASRTYTLTLADGATTNTAPAFSYGGTDYYAGSITLAATPTGWVYEYSVNGSPIDGNTFDISGNATVSRTAAHISPLLGYDDDPLVDGSADHPYVISTADGWNLLCDCLNDNTTWNRFSGKTVRLGADITVTRMAGGQYHDFCGTFDGQGNTLTVNISSDDITDGSTQYVAPFRYVSNTKADPSDEADSPATIRNLHVTGTITTDKQFTGGLIGGCWGTVIVENCRVSTAITSTISGDGTHGGIVGIQQNGSLYIRGTVFDGSLLGATTYAVGGFIGWRKSGVEIRNSLFIPAEVTVLNTSGATFARNKVDTYNSYYTYYLCDGTNYAPYDPADADHPDKYNNGHMRRTITAGDNVTIDAIALTGDATEYNVSGITAYSGGGLKLGDVKYYGSGDQVSLTLSNTTTGAPEGYTNGGYTASAGTLSSTENPYTLAMPDEDVTITVTLKKLMTNNDITVTIPSQTWTGNELTPVITVKDGENVLTENTDYTVTPPSGPIQDSGNHAYTITGMGNYAGSREATFTISPYLADQFGAVYVYQDQNGKTALLEGTSVDPVDIPSVINKTVNHVTNNRVFTPGKASTVMLPFNYACSGEEGGTFYKFVGVKKENDKWVATMQETGNDANNEGTLIANTPYLFMPAATTMTFPNINGSVRLFTRDGGSGGNCETADPGSHWTFKGTYEYMKWTTDTSDPDYNSEREAEIGRVYGFAGVAKTGIDLGDFVKAKRGARIRPMTCYLMWNDTPNNTRGMTRGTIDELPSSIVVRLLSNVGPGNQDDDDNQGGTTAIGTLDTETGEIDFGGWYDMSGRKLSAKPTQKGLYIHNGKKVIIK